MKLAIGAALLGLAAIVSGAFITSAKIALPPGQPEPGVLVHQVIGLLAIGLCLLLVAVSGRAQRIAAVGALAALIASAAIGWTHPLSHGAAVWHATMAHLFTASMGMALLTAPPVSTVPAGRFMALRPAAAATPIAVFFQIVMGALYRHEVTGILPHMLGAMVVALLAMIVSALVVQHFSHVRELKRAAALLISLVILQVVLGIAVFIMLLLNVSNTTAFVWTATAHATSGTLVFAASVLVAIEIYRRLVPGEIATAA